MRAKALLALAWLDSARILNLAHASASNGALSGPTAHYAAFPKTGSAQ